MYIVIGGAGKVGEYLTNELVQEGHDVFIIEENPKRLEFILNKNDVTGVAGNCASIEVLQEAEIEAADMYIAVTNSDEINMLSAMLAKRMGAPHTTVRIRNPIYNPLRKKIDDWFGIDLIINPDYEAAIRCADIVRNPHAIQVESFSKNRVRLIELHIDRGSFLAGLALSEFRQKYGDILIVAIERNNEIIIPSGKDVLLEGDNFCILGEIADIRAFYKSVGKEEKAINSLLIIGGGRISYYLAKMLAPSHKHVAIVEVKKSHAEHLASLLPEAHIFNGDGTDQEFLEELRIQNYDCVASLTGVDEENIMASLFASEQNVRKIITKVNRINLLRLLKDTELDAIVTPKFLVANRIIKKVRSYQASRAEQMDDIYRIFSDRAEAIMFTVRGEIEAMKAPLKDLPIRDDCVIACIIRENRVMYPGGNDSIQLGDQVLIVTTRERFDEVDDILEGH